MLLLVISRLILKKSLLTYFSGKVAVITASTDGIGFAIAKKLGHLGAKVVISSRKQDNVDKATKQLLDENIEVKSVVCHVSNKEHRKKLFDLALEFGGLDILVSNAAVNPFFGGMLDCEEAMFDKIFDVNVRSSFLLAKEALPLLRKSTHGRIVFVSSIAAYFNHKLLDVYSFSKIALNGLTKTIARQLAPEGITVNCICPGHIVTRFSQVLRNDEEKLQKELSLTPLGRFGRSEEVAAIVAFLVSDDASYITGENVVIAGGMMSRL